MSHNLSPQALDTVLDVVLQNMKSGEPKLPQTPENLSSSMLCIQTAISSKQILLRYRSFEMDGRTVGACPQQPRSHGCLRISHKLIKEPQETGISHCKFVSVNYWAVLGYRLQEPDYRR